MGGCGAGPSRGEDQRNQPRGCTGVTRGLGKASLALLTLSHRGSQALHPEGQRRRLHCWFRLPGVHPPLGREDGLDSQTRKEHHPPRPSPVQKSPRLHPNPGAIIQGSLAYLCWPDTHSCPWQPPNPVHLGDFPAHSHSVTFNRAEWSRAQNDGSQVTLPWASSPIISSLSFPTCAMGVIVVSTLWGWYEESTRQ